LLVLIHPLEFPLVFWKITLKCKKNQKISVDMSRLSCPCAFKSAVLSEQTVELIRPVFETTLNATLQTVREISGDPKLVLNATSPAWLPKHSALATTFNMVNGSEDLIRFCVGKFQKDLVQAIRAGVTALPLEGLVNGSSQTRIVSDRSRIRPSGLGSMGIG
jgi:hypothetical protein